MLTTSLEKLPITLTDYQVLCTANGQESIIPDQEMLDESLHILSHAMRGAAIYSLETGMEVTLKRVFQIAALCGIKINNPDPDLHTGSGNFY